MQQPKALFHTSPTTSAIQTTSLTTADKPNEEVLIKTHYSLVSAGTETLVAKGLVPESLHQQMEVPYMEGGFSFPIKYGYSLVGEVLSTGKWQGKKVHLMHPHQDICQVKTDSLFEIPAGVPLKRAILAANLETALNALWDANVQMGDNILVVGFGLIGSLVARLISLMPATTCTIVDIDPAKQLLAQKMGFVTANANTLPSNFDIAFHASAAAQGLQTCIDKVGLEGKIIELSWYGTKTSNIQLGGSFHSERKQIISSQVAHLPAHKNTRWNYYRRKKVVFNLLKNPLFDQHISHTINFNELPNLFTQFRNTNKKNLTYCVKY